MIENIGEKSQIIKLIKQSKTDNELKSMLTDLVNLLVVDNIDINELKTALRKTLNSNDVIKNIQDNNISNTYVKTKVQPKTKETLKQIIKNTIKENGNNCDLNFIDTSLITDMSDLFKDSTFNGDISKWNVSSVKYMTGMFFESNFNGDISKWDVSNVEYMAYMFCESNFNKDISEWNVSRVLDHENVFDDCPLGNNIKYQPKFKD